MIKCVVFWMMFWRTDRQNHIEVMIAHTTATGKDEDDHMKDNERVLKKCPFCGGYARFCEDMRFHEKKDSFPKWYVMCVGCNIRTPVADRTLVMKMWNKRAE